MLPLVPPFMGNSVFPSAILSSCTLRLPCGATYPNASPWNFTNRQLLPADNNVVVFNSRGGTPVPLQTVAAGGTAMEPPTPIHNGFTFGGWYTNEACTNGNEWNFSTMLTNCNTTLYAKWSGGGGCSGNPEAYGTAGSMGWSLCYGKLTITGEGAMPNYNTTSNVPPWYGNRSSIISVALDSRITRIGDAAFLNCTLLPSVTIPNSVTAIGNYAFQGCTNASFTSITISNSVTSIGYYAFQGCNKLTSITIPSSVTSIGSNAFQNCTGLTSVTIPNSVTSLGSWAFNNCTGLTSVIIGSGITTFESATFQGCSNLTSVTFGSNVTSIQGFALCPNINSITSLPLVPPTTQSFPVGCCLYVPAVALSAYQTAPVWSNFTCRGVMPGTYYAVTFDAQGGSSVASKSVEHDSTVQQPATPTRVGYTFAGWYQEAGCVTPWNFATPITGNLTLYAKWVQTFTVTFNAQGGSSVAAQQVQLGQLVQQPATNPTYGGYVFGGWYKESACLEQWNFATDVVPYSIILYAKWIPLYTVTFDAQGGTPPLTTQTVEQGQAVQAPNNPTRASYNFAGWFKEVLCTTAWSFASDVVMANTTLYAKWISTSATIDTVTFNSNSGSAVAAQPVERGETAAQPGNPTREGYTFGGWYTDNGTFSNAYNFSTAVSGSITLYALWQCTVTFNPNGGTAVSAQQVRPGEAAQQPTPPTRTGGYTFGGWYNELCLDSTAPVWSFSTTVNGNITLYAKWNKN